MHWHQESITRVSAHNKIGISKTTFWSLSLFWREDWKRLWLFCDGSLKYILIRISLLGSFTSWSWWCQSSPRILLRIISSHSSSIIPFIHFIIDCIPIVTSCIAADLFVLTSISICLLLSLPSANCSGNYNDPTPTNAKYLYNESL